MKTISKEAIGVVFRVTIKEDGVAVDISSATKKQISFRYPSNLIVDKDASFVTNGEDGVLQYVTTQKTELNETGTYALRCYIEMTGYSGYTSEAEGFTVK